MSLPAISPGTPAPTTPAPTTPAPTTPAPTTPAPTTLADLADLTGTRPVATVLHRSSAATLTLLSLPPDVVFPHHSAPRDAAVLGISGAATVDFGDERAAVTVGVGVPLPAGRGHRVEAGPEGAVLLLVVSHSA